MFPRRLLFIFVGLLCFVCFSLSVILWGSLPSLRDSQFSLFAFNGNAMGEDISLNPSISPIGPLGLRPPSFCVNYSLPPPSSFSSFSPSPSTPSPFRTKKIHFTQNVTFWTEIFAYGRDFVSQEILTGRGWDIHKSRAILSVLSADGENPKDHIAQLITQKDFNATPREREREIQKEREKQREKDGGKSHSSSSSSRPPPAPPSSPSSFPLVSDGFQLNPHNSNRWFLDIGSNVGWFSLLASSFGFSVVSIEPLQLNGEAFRSAICRNRKETKNFGDFLYFFPFGLSAGDKEGGECVVYSQNRNIGDGHVYCGEEGGNMGDTTIPKGIQKEMKERERERQRKGTAESHANTPLSALSSLSSPREYRIRHSIDLRPLDGILFPFLDSLDKSLWGGDSFRFRMAKIDVEGFEFHVLKGAKKSIQKGILPIILMEFSPSMLKEKGSDPLELLDFLWDNHYEIRIVRGRFNISEGNILQKGKLSEEEETGSEIVSNNNNTNMHHVCKQNTQCELLAIRQSEE